MLEITEGKIDRPVKVCLYGVEGIGKSTFASKFPNPLFLDLEHGTSQLNVKRISNIATWEQLFIVLDELAKDNSICDTVVIDTIDMAERYCINALLEKYNKKGIEDFGYGAGYTYLVEEFSNLMGKLNNLIANGLNVVLLAHATMKRISKPDDLGEYDHWELKLNTKTTNKVSPLVKEWTDLLLFANFKTTVITTDGNKKKATGGTRVMYTTHTPFADAKNRYGLSEMLPFDYKEIASIVPENNVFYESDIKQTQKKKQKERQSITKLKKLMNKDGITVEQVQKAVAEQGYYKSEEPIENYSDEFINNILIGSWDGVKNYIKFN